MRRVASIVGLLGAMFVSLPAHATTRTPEQKREIARNHLKQAKAYFMRGNYKGAVREWGYAYNYKQEPALLFNIAQAYRLSGQRSEARHEYQMYLSELPQAPNRQEVERFIARMDEAPGK